jgi:8-oxo-dGTP pyrophosphatase MutT (NUDIX family)
MLIENPGKIDRFAVGCICAYKSKYLLFHRVKDGFWNSVAGNIEKDETPDDAIVRELKEEIGLKAKPSFMTFLHHKYGKSVVEYNLFSYDFRKNPLNILKLNKKEHCEMGLFTLVEALKLNLYEDEDYCLKLHSEFKKSHHL